MKLSIRKNNYIMKNIKVKNGQVLRINELYEKSFPKNCPVIEKTADGVEVGVCTFYLPDNVTCPRHGIVKTKDTYETNPRTI